MKINLVFIIFLIYIFQTTNIHFVIKDNDIQVLSAAGTIIDNHVRQQFDHMIDRVLINE